MLLLGMLKSAAGVRDCGGENIVPAVVAAPFIVVFELGMCAPIVSVVARIGDAWVLLELPKPLDVVYIT